MTRPVQKGASDGKQACANADVGDFRDDQVLAISQYLVKNAERDCRSIAQNFVTVTTKLQTLSTITVISRSLYSQRQKAPRSTQMDPSMFSQSIANEIYLCFQIGFLGSLRKCIQIDPQSFQRLISL